MTGSRANSGESGALLTAITVACKGLVYTSESDYPVEPFFVGNSSKLPPQDLVDETKRKFKGKFAEADFDQFFARLTKDQPWHTSLKKREVKKFRALRNLLKTNLKNLRVFRYGDIQVDIIVFGEDADGDLVGIKTRSIET
jgi:hypothetical protein